MRTGGSRASGGAEARGKARLLLGFVLGVLLLSGCRMGLDLNVLVESDASGLVEVVVVVDSEAVDRVGGDLSAVLALESLTSSGWQVEGPSVDDEGLTRLRISQGFGSPAEAAALFAQIAPEGGPFQDFRVVRGSSFAETSVGFRGRVDFSPGSQPLGSDPTAGLPDDLGRTVEDIEAQLGESLDRLLQVRVSVRLPGDVSSNATTKADNGAVWAIGFGAGAIDLEADGVERRTVRLVLLGVGALLVVAAAMALLFRLARRTIRG